MWIFRAEELRNVTKDPRDKSGLMKNSVVTIKSSAENMSGLGKVFKSSNLHIPKSIRLKRLNYPCGEIKKKGGLMVWKCFNPVPPPAGISDSFSREIILTFRKLLEREILLPPRLSSRGPRSFLEICKEKRNRILFSKISNKILRFACFLCMKQM